MIRCSFGIIQLLTISLLTASCSSEEKKTVRTAEEDKTDSISMVYDPRNADKKIDTFIKNLHKTRGFNGNVLVAKDGKILYQNAIGWADYLRRDSLKIDYQFELASVSKPFTATAILMLVDQDKIKLTQTVQDFYPDFPYPGITIKMLLSHRSGMMNYVYFIDGIWRKEHKDQRKGITNQEVMRIIAERKPTPYTTPDRKFHYNNSNFMVLAAIVEKVSGKRFSQFMKENIFEPAGMKNTAVYSKSEYEKIPVKVVGHDRGTWRYSVVQNFLDGPVGDKGIYSTVRDLYLFDRALRRGKLVSKALQDSAYTGRSDTLRGHFNYGYGWRLFEGEHKVAYHTGWWHGFRHIYLRDLSSDITIVLLTNLTNGSLLRLDDLFKMVGMPVVRKSAYTGTGDTADD